MAAKMFYHFKNKTGLLFRPVLALHSIYGAKAHQQWRGASSAFVQWALAPSAYARDNMLPS